MRRVDQVGGVAVAALSEKIVDISAPPGAIAVVVKLVHDSITRPVSGSTSANSLSATSTALTPLSWAFGLVAGRISNGPCQVWPKSVERCIPSVCAVPLAPSFLTTIEKYRNVEPPAYFTSGSPNTCGYSVAPIALVPVVIGSWPASVNEAPPLSE